MGQSMVSSPYFVLSATDLSREAVVDHSKANSKGIPGNAKRGNSLSDTFWTEILSARNLESPGYHETIDAMKKLNLIKSKHRNSSVDS